MLCSCPRDQRCAACRSSLRSQLGGVAARRGECWAESVAQRCRWARTRTWPAHEGRAAQIARSKIADLTDDAELREVFAVLCARQAARWWSAWCGGDVATDGRWRVAGAIAVTTRGTHDGD